MKEFFTRCVSIGELLSLLEQILKSPQSQNVLNCFDSNIVTDNVVKAIPVRGRSSRVQNAGTVRRLWDLIPKLEIFVEKKMPSDNKILLHNEVMLRQ